MHDLIEGNILGIFSGECEGENKQDPAHTPGVEGSGEHENAPAAGVQTATEREKDFRALMEGEYKDLFTAYFQETFNRRFKEHKTVKAEWERLRPLYAALTERYGTEDCEALLTAIRAENTSNLAPTAAESPAAPPSPVPAAPAPAEEILAPPKAESAADPTAATSPGTGAENAVFPHETVPDLEAVRAAARRELLESIRARGLRPAENALGTAALGRGDLRLTREEREELARRAAKGEHVTL